LVFHYRSNSMPLLKKSLSQGDSRKVQMYLTKPRRRDIMVIVSANRAKDRGFESHQGVRFLRLIHCIAVLGNLICIGIVCSWEKQMLKKIQ
jgi:hypothetical protein